MTDQLVSSLVNVVLLFGIPFGLYGLYLRWREKLGLREVARRAGLVPGEKRYIGYCAAFAVAAVAAIVVWPPPVEQYARDGSAFQWFVGRGFTGSTLLAALLYGFVKTGFAEEFLFRGLIAGSLGRRLPLVWANLIQSAIFLLPHLVILKVMPEMWGILPMVFVGSLYVGWVRIKSGSILGPWLVHASLNVAVSLSVATAPAG